MLAGIRILDVTDRSAWLAGKILAELGADVVKVEPPGGDPGRGQGPFLGGQPGPERGLAWLALNTSKRSVVLEVGSPEFRGLAARADVLLESSAPGWMAERGVGYEQLRGLNPRLVYCAITPFGQTGPYASYQASDLVVVAMGGNASMTGEPDRAPLRCTFPTSTYHACPEAALGVVLALHARERSGQGQLVDVSQQECQLGTLLSGPGQAQRSGRVPRRGGARVGRTREIWATRDGFVSFGLRGGPARIPNLIATVELMHESGMAPQWLRDYDWPSYNANTLSDQEIARLEGVFAAFFRTKSMRDLFEEALRRRILLAPCNDAAEILAQPQLRERALFVRLDYPELGTTIEHPARFAQSCRGRIGVRSRAPRLGEHHEEVLAELERLEPNPEELQKKFGRAGSQLRPFEGLRMLEFGAGAAGPLATRYFAELGARVVRVESTRRPDFLRLLHLTPDNPFGLDGSPMFVLLNPDKESVCLDLTRPEGAALARRLVAWADVVSENFAPGVMARFGLDPTKLRADRPELVTISGCLFGQTGSQRLYPGFGGQGSAIAGFNAVTGWPDREAIGPYAAITDSLAPRYVACLIAAALLERDRTGRGQCLDLSQIETGVYSLSELIVRYSATGEVPLRLGNHHEAAAPHGVYPCQGEDRWIAIAVLSDEEWRALARVLACTDERFDSQAGRLAHEEELDAVLAAWSRGFEAHALMARLQGEGVRAGVVQDFQDLVRDPQLASRGHFRRLQHVHLGEMAFEHTGIRLSESPPRLERAGPNLGEHNAAVLGGILGLTADEIERLVADGVVV
jgi:crotonobetainyl-CoA:carnitine CoA-transferase CaiB-like acyl-CoA transferase